MSKPYVAYAVVGTIVLYMLLYYFKNIVKVDDDTFECIRQQIICDISYGGINNV